jgi:hypothetical protein
MSKEHLKDVNMKSMTIVGHADRAESVFTIGDRYFHGEGL